MTILIVEDDADINALLACVMRREGFDVVRAYSGTEALLHVERTEPSLVLLDMMLPGVDGPEFLRQLRDERGCTAPVIVVSAKAGLGDKVDMLALGADDYITKPFEPDEVAARVQAVLRRVQATGASCGSERDVFVHRDLRLDELSRSVYLGEQEVVLTAHEFDILQVLIQQPGRVFSREALYERVWKNGYYGEDNAVNVHVSNIRKKFAAVDAEADYIKTVWGIGFKLV